MTEEEEEEEEVFNHCKCVSKNDPKRVAALTQLRAWRCLGPRPRSDFRRLGGDVTGARVEVLREGVGVLGQLLLEPLGLLQGKGRRAARRHARVTARLRDK